MIILNRKYKSLHLTAFVWLDTPRFLLTALAWQGAFYPSLIEIGTLFTFLCTLIHETWSNLLSRS